MDYFVMALIYSRRVVSAEEQEKLRARERWLVLEKNVAVFGESTIRGELTANCAASFREFGLDLPPGFAVGENEVLVGELI